jgi:hypothetical protein
MKMVKDGLLPSHSVGAHHRFTLDDVTALAASRRADRLKAITELRALDEELEATEDHDYRVEGASSAASDAGSLAKKETATAIAAGLTQACDDTDADEYLTPAATWKAIRDAARNGSTAKGGRYRAW